ncbi:MAG: YceD family protein [Betaproteobacteria bacterium]
MARRPIDPQRLDVEAFARDGGTLEGAVPLALLPRLLEAGHAGQRPGADDAVRWRAYGEWRRTPGSGPQPWLHLQADAELALECQRCLGPLPTALQVDRWFRFAPDEDTAAALDAEVEEDVLALGRPLDLVELIEDELLLALPLVPRHEACPEPLLAPDDGAAEAEAERPNPFAALEALKRHGGR